MIKLSLWQRFEGWFYRPFWENVAIEMCDKHRDKVLSLSLEKRKKFWDLVMDDETIDIKFRYNLEKDHKEHFGL